MYRKLSSSQIFDGYEILSGKQVLIIDSKGKIIDIVGESEAGEGIEYFEGILSPGFINCHCHLELSHMKGKIPKHSGLIDFVMKIVEHRSSDEILIQSAIKEAETEMINNGIVAVGDICNTNYTIAQKSNANLHYQNFIEVSGFPKKIATQRFEQISKIYQEFSAQLPFNSIVPHAPYSVSTDLLGQIMNFEKNEIVTMHNQETIEENELFKTKTGDFLKLYQKLNIDTHCFESNGDNSLIHFMPYFKKSMHTILVHNVFTQKEDIQFAKQYFESDFSNLFFCLCPNANEYISNKLPNVDLFFSEDCRVVLGTDSLASNDELSIWSEIKTIQKSFPDISISNLLKSATSNGAKALKIEAKYGSFEKGKQPGVILIQEDKVVCLLKV